MEKKYLEESEKIKLLEHNNMLMARQLDATSLRDRFIDLTTNIIPMLQKNLDGYTSSLLAKYNCEGGTIESDYSVNPKE